MMLLHGLAGQATEWNDTARWLSKHNRVVALAIGLALSHLV